MMLKTVWMSLFVSLCLLSTTPASSQWTFVRGDTVGDGEVSISDPILSLLVLFTEQPTDCWSATDADDNGELDLADPIYVLSFIFGSGPPPPPPFPNCGVDPTPDAFDCSGPRASCFGPASPTMFNLYSFSTGDSPSGIEAVDITGDGVLDLVCAMTGEDQVWKYQGIGTGSFAALPPTPCGDHPQEVAAADFNADGFTDVVTADEFSGTMSYLEGDGVGAGGLTYIGGYFAGDGLTDVEIGDLDGDGDLDVALVDWAADSIRIVLSNGDGTFVVSSTSLVVGDHHHDLELADLNGDGNLDIVGTAARGDFFRVFLGNGDGTFALQFEHSINGCYDCAIGDLNGDGILDLAVTELFADAIWNFPGNGDGTFDVVNATSHIAGVRPSHVILADMDNSGTLDIVTAAWVPSSSKDVNLLLGVGDGTFFDAVSYSSPMFNTPRFPHACDLDNDGYLDLVLTDGQSDRIWVLTNTLP